MHRTPLLALALALLPAGLAAQDAAPQPLLIDRDADVERRTVLDGTVVLEDVPEIPDRVVRALARYQNTRSAGLVDWTADGTGLYVTTRFGDVSQLHRVDRPGGMRRQLTWYPEPVGGIARRPGSEEVLFGMDEGGSEFYQLHLLDPATGEARRLTDGESRNGGAEWSPDGRRLAWTSTRRNGRSNDVWVMEVADTASARIAVEAPDGASWGAADWDAAGTRLLIEQYVSITDSRVHLLDLATGELVPLAGGDDRPASWLGIEPAFTADGRGAFLATDDGSEFRRLVRLDLATGDVEPLTADIPWDMEAFALDATRARAAFATNEDGISRLYLLDPATGERAAVEGLPVGDLGRLEFAPDGSRLAFTLSTARSPSDVFVLDLPGGPLEAGDLVQWTHSEIGGLDPAGFVEPELVRFESFDGRRIPAFVYLPEGEGPFPVVLSIHGGPESQYRPGFSSTFQMWANVLGVAVVAPNVRGSSGYGKEYVALDNGVLREDSVRDIGALLDWIAERPDLDEERVAVYGGSYGGYMVLASLVRYPERIGAGVDYVGISNFVTFLENTQDYRRDLRRPEYGDERDPAMRAHLEAISPSNHADRIRSALFVAQGANDPRVPESESEQIVREVRSTGQPVWYMLARNEGHGFAKKPNRDLFGQIVVLFLERSLRTEEVVASRP